MEGVILGNLAADATAAAYRNLVSNGTSRRLFDRAEAGPRCGSVHSRCDAMRVRKITASSGVPSVRWHSFVTLQETVRSRLLVIVQPLECHYLVILIKINKQVLAVSNELCTTLNAMQIDDP